MGVDLKYLRAERSSEFLVLIVSSPEIKSPSSFGGLCIKQHTLKTTKPHACSGQETASDVVKSRCSISHHDSQSHS